MASATGIFDIRECIWDSPLLKFLNVKTSNLPPIAEDHQTLRLNRRFARRWPRLADAAWFPAIGDGAANNIGSGCVSKKRAALMIGTSGAMRVAYRGEPPKKIPDGLWCYRIDRERAVIGGALSDGGGLYDWLRENVRLPSNAERVIAKRQPAAHGLTFLPFFAGERSTGYHENAHGAVLGLTAANHPIDILQAAMEAVGFRFAEIFDQLHEVADIKEIVASGGALRASSVWTQMIADILGRDITLVEAPEASLRGVALASLERIDSAIHEPSLRGTRFTPDQNAQTVYSDARARHEGAYLKAFGES